MAADRLIRVMLISGDPLQGQRVRGFLAADERFEVTLAQELCGGLECLAETHFDAVLLDMLSSGERPLDHVARLRVDVPEVPIVVLVGSEEQIGCDAVEAGADGYVSEEEAGGALSYALVQAITRARTKTHIVNSERRFRALIENSTDAVVIIAPDGHVTYHSPSFKHLLGYEEWDNIGVSFVEFLHPEDLPAAVQIVGDVIANPGLTKGMEGRAKNKDGSWHWIEGRAYNYLADPAVQGIVINLRDINDRKRAEEALRAREVKLNQIFDTVRDEIVLVDLTGKVLEVNKGVETIFGFSPQEVLGRNLMELNVFDADQLAELAKSFAAVATGDQALQPLAGVRARHKDGHEISVEANATLLRGAEGQAEGFLCTIRDITGRRRTEELLQASERRFRALIEHSGDGMLLLDATANVIYVSPGTNRLMGYLEDESLGIAGFDFIHPEDAGRVVELYTKVVAAPGVPLSADMRVKHKDGSWHHVEGSATNYLDDPAVGAVVINIHDITDRKEAEEALKAREEFYSHILQHVDAGITIISADAVIRYESPSVAKLLGSQKGQGSLGLDYVHPEDLPRVLDLVQRMFQKQASVLSGEFRIRQDDGAYRWLAASGVDCTDDPAVKGFLIVFSEITERRKAEDKLRASEERFRALIEHSSDGIVILSPEGAVLYASPGLSRMMGFEETEALGFSFAEFLNPEDLTAALSVIAEIMPNPGSSGKLEVRSKHKDGTWHWFEARATNHVKDPAIKGLVINLRDISDRRKAEEALKAREEFYTRVLSHVEAAIMVVDTSGKVTYQSASGERLWGKVSETGGTIGFDVIHPDDLPNIMQQFMEMMQGKISLVTLECRIKHRDGTWHWSSSTGASCLSDPVVNGVVIVTTDITERKKIEDAVKQYAETLSAQNVQLDAARSELSNLNQGLEQKVQERTSEVENLLKQKDQFISQLGHDLKSPLTPLVTLLPILREDVKDPEQQEIVDVAITNVNFMRDLVTKTLKLAKLTSGRNDPITGRARMRKQLDAVLKGRKTVADRKHITIETLVDDDIVVQLEDLDLQELFDNTINNAIKFTPEGGRITIDAVLSEPFVTVSVKDTGIGMTPEQLSHLFEEFYKADPSRHELDSSGLGLSICKRIVERAGGKIWAESQGSGKGTTLFFTLRLAKSDTNSVQSGECMWTEK